MHSKLEGNVKNEAILMNRLIVDEGFGYRWRGLRGFRLPGSVVGAGTGGCFG
jgi:hypothetical protein